MFRKALSIPKMFLKWGHWLRQCAAKNRFLSHFRYNLLEALDVPRFRLVSLQIILLITLFVSFLFLDRPLTLFFIDNSSKPLRSFCRFGSLLIAPLLHLILWPSLFLFAYILKNRAQKALFQLTLHILTINGIITFLKVFFGRPRPKLFYTQDLYKLSLFSFDNNFHSFPSRHTATILIIALFFSHLYPRRTLAFIAPAIAISFTRIPLNSHYLSDILGGILFPFFAFPLTQYLLILLRRILDDKTSRQLSD